MDESGTTSTENAISKFRDTLNNNSRIVNLMIKNRKHWNKVCSSMDVIDHTEAALIHYELMPETKSMGQLYLDVFGLFQSMVVQQDAVKHLYECLEIKFESWKEDPLSKIRNLRNDTVGHPTNRDIKVEPRSSTFYSMSWHKDDFELILHYHKDDMKSHHSKISPLKLITEQREVISMAIKDLTTHMEKIENSHKLKFQSIKMEDFFNGYGYHFGKILTEIDRGSYLQLASASFNTIKNYVDKFKNELEQRELSGALGGVECSLEEIKHPESRLAAFFEGDDIHPKDAYSFAIHYQSVVEEIIEMAKEIDQSYLVDNSKK